MKYSVFTAFFLLGSIAFGFDWQKCTSQGIGGGGGLGVTTSSGQFTSSTGGCAGVGINSTKDKVLRFVVLNSESIQNDLSRNNGETLATLQHIAELSEYQTAALSTSSEARKLLLKKDYDHFYELLLKL